MKGRLYKSKPLPPKNEIIEFFLHKPCPRRQIPEKFYSWRSSIPDKWVSLKGNTYFKHNSLVKHPRLSVDLLQNSPRYVSSFRASSVDLIHKPLPLPLPLQKSSPREDSPIKISQRRLSLPIHRPVDRDLLITGESTPNIFVKYPRANTVREARSPCSSQNNNKIDEFLKRFENKTVAKESPQANRGMHGLKLRHLREGRNNRKKPDYCAVFNVKKQSDNPFSRLHPKHVSSTE